MDYTLRAPSVGSDNTGSGDSERGTPQSNEWDTDAGQGQRLHQKLEWHIFVGAGHNKIQLVAPCDSRVRFGPTAGATTMLRTSYPIVGFRPVLEVLNPDTLGSDGLKVVTLDLGGGTLGRQLRGYSNHCEKRQRALPRLRPTA